ncbi:hypothetical protein GCM10027203_73960 [Nonomuraea fastidiosa]
MLRRLLHFMLALQHDMLKGEACGGVRVRHEDRRAVKGAAATAAGLVAEIEHAAARAGVTAGTAGTPSCPASSARAIRRTTVPKSRSGRSNNDVSPACHPAPQPLLSDEGRRGDRRNSVEKESKQVEYDD